MIYYNIYCIEAHGKEQPYYYGDWSNDDKEIIERAKTFLLFHDSFIVEIRIIHSLYDFDSVETIGTFALVNGGYYKLKESDKESWINCETLERLNGSALDYL